VPLRQRQEVQEVSRRPRLAVSLRSQLRHSIEANCLIRRNSSLRDPICLSIAEPGKYLRVARGGRRNCSGCHTCSCVYFEWNKKLFFCATEWRACR
jgi:hypothetical protein